MGHKLATGRVAPRSRAVLTAAESHNALKYTSANGRVTLGLRRNGVSAEILVRDTGVSIAQDELPHVFERYPADPARGRDPAALVSASRQSFASLDKKEKRRDNEHDFSRRLDYPG